MLATGLVELVAVLCLMANGAPILSIFGVFTLKLSMVTFSQTVNTVKSEIFPSLIRVSALSVSGTCGRMGALLAPALIEETRGAPGSPEEFQVFLTLLAAVLLVAAGLGVFLVPETKGKSLA
ncbi:unnamed protein product [Effrenium voratum]|uniref:Major facilitator superfamily (MFS) profile domain-containing protein n=1 Tax=Effrenium voratum TaxID=2562239 RepID=A0AA36HTI5_9DINO|nr:unnamed protein product [Effrenium voratum]